MHLAVGDEGQTHMTTVFAASHVPADNPRVAIFVIAAFLCLAVTQLPALVKRGVSFDRRCYWGGTAGTMVCVFLAALPDWLGGLVFGAATLFGMDLAAYFTSSYIKIGGRIYREDLRLPRGRLTTRSAAWACTAGRAGPRLRPASGPVRDRRECSQDLVDDSAGHRAVSLTVATNLGHDAKIGLAIGAAIVLVAAGLGYGVMDASWNYPIARGQYVQFVLVAVVTAGVFTVFYLAGFGIGRRWPMRPKRSLERAVHPRFRNEPRGKHVRLDP